ncbi:MAG: alpha-L-fucosidase [Bacteroidales bacterium]|nr:alpha-L-fucosidase [Bacteroidales bacterium]
MKKIIMISLLAILCAVPPQFAAAQESQNDKQSRMQWFDEARLGIFIHWGIYAVNGIDESWSFFNGYISHDDYMKQIDGFSAKHYDPQEWAALIKESGAKYAVLTSKHHDGVALWPTKCNNRHLGKDYIKPFMKALRKEGLKTALYFSLLDWSHPDYPNFTREQKRYENDSIRWNRFVDFNFCQIIEILGHYNPDLWWFDGDWEQSAEKWKAPLIRETILTHNPAAIINSRLQGYGDYATPEQGLPVHKPEDQYWELCMTMNDSWGYQHNDLNYKTPNQVIRIFVDCISMGGNLLLDIGPKADGTIPEEQVMILQELGRWTAKHAEAIYGTRAGIPKNYFYGPTTLSADSNTLYLFLDHQPTGPVMIKGLKNKVNRIRVVGNGTKLSYDIKMKQYWSQVPGILYIDLPETVFDPHVTVIAILLDGEIELYE